MSVQSPLEISKVCAIGNEMASYWPLSVIQSVQVLFSIATIIMFVILVQLLSKHKLYFHNNFQLILKVAGWFYFQSSIMIIIVQIFHQYAYHISPYECRAVLIRWKCLLLRIPGYSPIICFSLLHLFIFAERCCATFFLKSYEKAPKRYGYAAVALLLTIFFLWVFYIFHDEDLFRYNPYCGATSPTSAPKILNTYYVMLGLDFACTCGDFWLMWLSKKRMARRNTLATSRHLRTMPGYYQLSQSYQLRENQVTTALVFPFVIAHSLVFFTYLILTTYFRLTIGSGETPVLYTTSVEGAHIIVTVYTFATLFLLWFLHRRIYKRRNQGILDAKVSPQTESDLYFKMFNTQITG